MQKTASLIVLTGVALIASWVLVPSAPAAPSRTRLSPGLEKLEEVDAFQQVAAPILAQVTKEVERMRERLTTPPAFPEPSRDPFRFGRRPDPPRPKTPEPAAPTVSAAPAPALPLLPRLVAIMTGDASAGVATTAAFSAGEDVQVVKVGDPIGRFLVRSIDGDTVELADPLSSATFRIILR